MTGKEDLHVFWIGPDAIVARSQADAIIIWEAHTNEKASDYNIDVYMVYRVDDNTELVVMVDKDDKLLDKILVIKSGAVKICDAGKYLYECTATAATWVGVNGRGFLCSTEQ